MTFPRLVHSAIVLAFLIPAIASANSNRTGNESAGGRSEDASQTRIVSYQDLDLRILHDQHVLEQRVEAATESLCGVTVSTIWFYQRRSERECRAGTLADVRPQIAAAIRQAQSRVRAELSSVKVVVRRLD